MKYTLPVAGSTAIPTGRASVAAVVAPPLAVPAAPVPANVVTARVATATARILLFI